MSATTNEFMGYETDWNTSRYILVDQAYQSQSFTGDDLAILRGEDGHLYEFMNGQLTRLKDGPYTLRKENDFEVQDDRFIRRA